MVCAPRDSRVLCKLREKVPVPTCSSLGGLSGAGEAWPGESEKTNRHYQAV